MEDEISCDDPQFMNMLETCMRVEIGIAKGTLSNLDSEIKELKVKIRKELQARKELKDKTRNTQENFLILNTTLNKQNKYIKEISERIELMKLNLDNDYKIMKMECDQFKNIYNEYEEAWQSYHTKYEEFPLAKTRKEAKTRLEKLRVDKMVIEYKINELKKTQKLNEHVTWLRTRDKIVEFASAISNGLKLDQTLSNLNKSIEDCKEELIVANAELAARMKEQEEEKRKRALKMLEMPPPRINFSHIRSIYGRRVKTGFAEGWKKNYENSIDSLSVDTTMLEEMCAAEENSAELSQLREENDPSGPASPIDELSPSPDPDDREEAERNEVASEMDEDDGRGIDPAADKEMEQEPFEELALPSSVPKDKQTVQRSGDRADGSEDPPAKRMKLIQDEEEASPATKSKAVRAEKKRSQLAEPTAAPRITKIESVRYNVSELMNADQGSLNPLVPSRSSQLSDPEARMTKVASVRYSSPARQLDQSNPNPSSMFTPRQYDYSDNSDISFCVNNNMSLKDDQISMYGGSVRDFCECSNISNPMEEEEGVDNASVSSTRKKAGFPKFDFSNIMKGNNSRNTLF